MLKTEPAWEALPPTYPTRLTHVLQTCLQKDPKQRIHDAADVRLAMDGAFEAADGSRAAGSDRPHLHLWQRPVPALLALVAAVVGGGVVARNLAVPGVRPADVVRFGVTRAETARFTSRGTLRDLAISLDGTQLVYIGSDRFGPALMLHPVGPSHGRSAAGRQRGC